MKLVKLLSYVFLHISTIVRTVFAGVIIKDIGVRVIALLEDADGLDAGEVFFADDC